MCGIFGAIIASPTKDDFQRIENLFRAIEPRGPHATGVAYVKNNQVHIETYTTRAEFFVDCCLRLENMVNEDGNLYILGHTRWTTSGWKDHQPLGGAVLAIAHNGIVDRDSPNEWYDKYNIETWGSNDSELIYHVSFAYHFSGHRTVHPLQYFTLKNQSIAVCELFIREDGLVDLYAYRNHARPLAVSLGKRHVVFASTSENLIDAGFSNASDCHSYINYLGMIEEGYPGIAIMNTFPSLYLDLEDYGDK